MKATGNAEKTQTWHTECDACACMHAWAHLHLTALLLHDLVQHLRDARICIGSARTPGCSNVCRARWAPDLARACPGSTRGRRPACIGCARRWPQAPPAAPAPLRAWKISSSRGRQSSRHADQQSMLGWQPDVRRAVQVCGTCSNVSFRHSMPPQALRVCKGPGQAPLGSHQAGRRGRLLGLLLWLLLPPLSRLGLLLLVVLLIHSRGIHFCLCACLHHRSFANRLSYFTLEFYFVSITSHPGSLGHFLVHRNGMTSMDSARSACGITRSQLTIMAWIFVIGIHSRGPSCISLSAQLAGFQA